MKFTFFFLLRYLLEWILSRNNEKSKAKAKANFPIIFISRFSLSSPLVDSALVCVCLHIASRQQKHRGPLFFHTYSLLHLAPISARRLFPSSNSNSLATGPFCHLRQWRRSKWTTHGHEYFFPFLILPMVGSLYCSSFPYFHGFMILYVFHSDFFHIAFFRQIFSFVVFILGNSFIPFSFYH